MKKEVRDLLHQEWWGKTSCRVEIELKQECSLINDPTKIQEQVFVSSKHNSKALYLCQS